MGNLVAMRHTRTTLYMTPALRRISIAVLVSGALGVLFYAYLHFSENGFFPPFRKNLSGFAICLLLGSVTGVSLYFANKLLNRWVSWNNHFATRLLLGYLSNFILALGIVSLAGWLIDNVLGPAMLWKSFTLRDPDLALKTIILLASSLFIYTIVYALLYSYQHYAVAQIETLQNERKQLELQFEALKSQISPHYLFNSLNTISSLIYKDPRSAEQFIRRLAQTYQYILSTQDKPYVLLKDEVEFVQSYYYLLRIRFQQQLTVDINLPSGIMNSRIPPLTLQMLVENAVKHNNPVNDKKLFIYITAQDNTYLKVINTKTENYFNVSSFKVGLENIRKRYKFFTEKQIEITDNEKFIVSLPVINERSQRNSA
jgi:two-component system, LytTR family, sensor kinase